MVWAESHEKLADVCYFPQVTWWLSFIQKFRWGDNEREDRKCGQWRKEEKCFSLQKKKVYLWGLVCLDSGLPNKGGRKCFSTDKSLDHRPLSGAMQLGQKPCWRLVSAPSARTLGKEILTSEHHEAENPVVNSKRSHPPGFSILETSGDSRPWAPEIWELTGRVFAAVVG